MEYVKPLLKIIDGVGDGEILSDEIAGKLGIPHQKIVGSIKSVQSVGDGNMISVVPETKKSRTLTKEGEFFKKSGSYEYIVFEKVLEYRTKGEEEKGIQKTVLEKELAELPSPVKDLVKIGLSKAMMYKWLKLEKRECVGSVIIVSEGYSDADADGDKPVDKAGDLCRTNLDELKPADFAELKKRKLITESKETLYRVSKGPGFRLEIAKPETELTPEMIADGSWKNKEFKPLNFFAQGVMPNGGYLHPLLKVRAEYRQIFLEMGFSEMPTNNYVESSFWNFDALFQPQQHPARDAHDTFFLSDPATSKDPPPEYLEKVKRVHSKGDYGSQGYNYDWKIDEARKNILRTHTTAVSARMLYQLGQQEEFKPVKYFSIDRVFRNETLDATHLAEFHQIEGVVADYDLTLGHLMGVINEFFVKLGISNIRFKPAYNPYTEPSMEIFGYHPLLKKWVELGNSGIFRPEMLRPMGLPEDVVVIAWGLSLERPTMIKYGYSNIRDLIGPKVDLRVIQENPICRLDETPVH